MQGIWAARVVVGALVALAVAVPAGAVTVTGSSGPDTIFGTGRADTIDGRGGNDEILGFGGADLLTGGAGADRILAGSGNDRVRVRDGRRDVVDCGPGRDIARVDSADAVRRCEVVRRPVAVTPPSAPAPPSPVALENEEPGTPGWASFGVAPGRSIEGYTVPSARPGETIAFHVSAEPEESYRILVYRVGWYGGIGARLHACIPSCDGNAQAVTRPVPPADPRVSSTPTGSRARC